MLTVAASLTTSLRNASQRRLTPELGTWGATFVRFAFAVPFALAGMPVAFAVTNTPWFVPQLSAFSWLFGASIAQIAATALLLRTMAERNFALGVAYSNTQVLHVALFGAIVLGETLSATMVLAIAVGTVAVLLLSPSDRHNRIRAIVKGIRSRSALLGLACGALFALTSVAFRGAAVSFPDVSFIVASVYMAVVAQVIQTVLLGAYLLASRPDVLLQSLAAWRVSVLAGAMAATANVAWNAAYFLAPVAHVRALGLIEMVFGYSISRRVFNEPLSRVECLAMVMLASSVALVLLSATR